MLKNFAIAIAIAAFAVFEDSAAQIVTLNYTENDPRFQTEQPCQAFGGTVIALPDGKNICKDIDSAGTFCIIGSKTAFPCKGLYKHVTECNREYNRTAHSPFFCGKVCPDDDNRLARGNECVEGPFRCTTKTTIERGCYLYDATWDVLYESASKNDVECVRAALHKEPLTIPRYGQFSGHYLVTCDPEANKPIFPIDYEHKHNPCGNTVDDINYPYVGTRFSFDQVVPDDLSYYTPLHEAAHSDSCQVAELLIQNGANVNVKTKINPDRILKTTLHPDGLTVDSYPMTTPLHWAADRGSHEVAELLMLHGADVNATAGNSSTAQEGYTPLHYTVAGLFDLSGWFGNYIGPEYGRFDYGAATAEVLLQNGANPNIKSNNHAVPLHIAAHNGHFETVKLLLQHGADVNPLDGDGSTSLGRRGDTPLQIALKEKYYQEQNQYKPKSYDKIIENFDKIISILRKHGGRCNIRRHTGSCNFLLTFCDGSVKGNRRLRQC